MALRRRPAFAAGRDLKLKQRSTRRFVDPGPHQTRGDERLDLGGECQSLVRLRIIERLDAVGIARQQKAAVSWVVQGNGIHAAQMIGKTVGAFELD